MKKVRTEGPFLPNARAFSLQREPQLPATFILPIKIEPTVLAP
jgi:hypothetical protein